MDIGWSELLVIGIVALIVIGPKDLPRMFNALGRFTAKARAMGREFQRAMDEAARESGVKEASAEMKAMVSKKNLGLDKVEAAARKFESWDPLKATAPKPAAPPAPGSETAKLAETRKAEAEARAAETRNAETRKAEVAKAEAEKGGAAKGEAAKGGAAKAGSAKAGPAKEAPKAAAAPSAAQDTPKTPRRRAAKKPS